LATPAVHRRSVTLDSPGRRLTIVDTVAGPAPVVSVMSWHLGPAIMVDLDGAKAALSWWVGPEQRRGTLTLPSELAWTCQRGQVDPVGGWFSPRFGTRVPTTSLIGRGIADSSTPLVTEVELP
jgi:hypothetical protein